MDRLEDFIRNNREKMDIHDPSPELWKGIRKGVQNRRRTIFLWSAAASFLILAGSTIFFLISGNKEDYSARNETRMLKSNPQLIETEYYYSNLVNTLYNQASPMLIRYPDIKKELNADMSQIDSICFDIKRDLKDNVSNQQVIEALIKNYRIKIQILQEMIDLLKQEQDSTGNTNSHEL
jgi:hypothetical protein